MKRRRAARALFAGMLIAGALAVTPTAQATEEACNELGRGYNVMLPCSTVGHAWELIGRGYN